MVPRVVPTEWHVVRGEHSVSSRRVEEFPDRAPRYTICRVPAARHHLVVSNWL